MSRLKLFNIFQNPWLIFTVSVLAMAVMAGIRPVWARSGGSMHIVLPLLGAVLAFGIDFLVRTDYEKINSAIDRSAGAVVRGDIEQLGSVISSRYSDGVHDSKEELLATFQRILSGTQIEKIRQKYKNILLNKDQATVELEVRVQLSPNSGYGSAGTLLFVKLKIRFDKQGRNWLVNSADIVAVNNQPMGWEAAP